jgi:outer membrane protein TolC
MPLENRRARAEYGQASAERDKAEVRLKQTVVRINREVWDAFLNVKSLQKQLDQTAKTLELEEQKYNAELAQFRIARSNTERLTQFQNDWINAKVLNARNRQAVLVAQDRLSKAQGTLLKDVGLAGEKDDA